MRSKFIVLRAKISYMVSTIIKLWCIINHNGTYNNEWYFEDIAELNDNIDELYKQATMSENEYNEYMLSRYESIEFDDVFKPATTSKYESKGEW